ncbi:MAG TPA: pectin acetylesterase-family hydrolase [Kofleriaceae bacterium]
MRISHSILGAALLGGCGAAVTLEEPTSDQTTDQAAALFVAYDSLADLPLIPEPYPEDGGAYSINDSMQEGTNLWKVPLPQTLGSPACVDLSQPVFYVHAAPVDSPYRNNWVFFVQGGGSVQGTTETIDKYFGGSHGEMSSRWAPPSIGPGGILDPTDLQDNPFHDFNMVFIHKCSFDRFMGRLPAYAATLPARQGIAGYWPNGPYDFEIGVTLDAIDSVELAFQGHDIVDGVIDALADTTVSYDPGTGPVAMPSLANADTVLFIGHSGGARGATMIIDDVAARIRTKAQDPDVRFVMDGAFDPGAESMLAGATYGVAYPTNDPDNNGNPLATAQEKLDGFLVDWGADGDATCLANSTDTAKCGDVIHVLMNWIETPMYIRQDLADQNHTTSKDENGDNVLNCWRATWNPDAYGCDLTTLQHGAEVIAQVADLNLMRTRALTATVLNTTVARPSGFFPACGYHDGAHTDLGFDSTLRTAGGVLFRYSNALFNWFRFPNIPVRVVEATSPGGIPGGCATPP